MIVKKSPAALAAIALKLETENARLRAHLERLMAEFGKLIITGGRDPCSK
jgi:hypothetical protein